MIQSHYHQRNGPWAAYDHTSEVLPTETKTKAAENVATDVEGEWNCSHIHSRTKGSIQKAINRERETGWYNMSCHSNYSVMDKIIDVKSVPSVKGDGYHKV